MSQALARICCLDLDTFFVSVERLLDPSLQGRPVVVGGRKGQRGVVTAASYEVRAFGVRSGMSMTEAVRRAPNAVYLPVRHGVYGPYAKQVKAILQRYTPEVKTASIDEFFLDFHGCERLYQRPHDPNPDATIERVIRRMRQDIQDEIGLPASAGVGVSRTVAKISSSLAKPAGVLMVRPGQERHHLSRLPVRKVPGVGPVAEKRLRGDGIHTIHDLLQRRLGAPHGALAEGLRRALDGSAGRSLGSGRPAFLEHDPARGTVGSISNERTFSADVGDHRVSVRQLRALSERVAWRARRRGVKARTVHLKLRFADFHTLTRSHTGPAIDSESGVFERVSRLFYRAMTPGLSVRLLGVGLSNLMGESRQLALPLQPDRRPEVGQAIDAVRERFGYDAVRLGVAKSRSGGPASGAQRGWQSIRADDVGRG